MAEGRRRTPQQKKTDEYDRDHHQPNSHGFWRDWREAKTRAHRKTRRKASRLEREAAATVHDPEAFEAAERRVVHRTSRLTKGGTPTVRERVRSQREARLWKTGWDRFFSRPFDPAADHRPFRQFLQSLMRGRSGHAAELARYFRAVLAAPRRGRGAHGVRGTTARWLHQYFAEDPSLEARFYRWVAEAGAPAN
jgi:hypothetical protein